MSRPGDGWLLVIDILLVTLLNFYLFKLVRGTRAWKFVIGIGFFVLALYLSDIFGLHTLHWILEKASVAAPIALVILFLPELRHLIEGFAKVGVWTEKLISGSDPGLAKTMIDSISDAVDEMAQGRIGALIVIERDERLDDIARNGVPLNAKVTAELLGAIFFLGNPLHDGAAILRRDTLVAAACRLPLSDNPEIDSHYHMRHRAGIGVSEHFDCVVLIVSEERGEVSVAVDGELMIMESKFGALGRKEKKKGPKSRRSKSGEEKAS